MIKYFTCYSLLLLVISLLTVSCYRSDSAQYDDYGYESNGQTYTWLDIRFAYDNEFRRSFVSRGLVDLHSIDPSINVNLVNSDAKKNYFREDFYNGLRIAYMRRGTALKLKRAQGMLRETYPDYSLMVMDAARPLSVTRQMFEIMEGTRYEKYVAHPAIGSIHNYGTAVDLTIIDGEGNELDMGFLPFYRTRLRLLKDYLGSKRGLSPLQQSNRMLLTNVMCRAGFSPKPGEWWHFNSLPEIEARRKYKPIK